MKKHLHNGDFDDEGNLTFLHPYCRFCNKYYFSEDKFKVHLNQAHYTCHVCTDDYKFTYYKDYKSLENHFKLSHFFCEDNNCREKGFVVFSTLGEFE